MANTGGYIIINMDGQTEITKPGLFDDLTRTHCAVLVEGLTVDGVTGAVASFGTITARDDESITVTFPGVGTVTVTKTDDKATWAKTAAVALKINAVKGVK